MVSSFPEAVGVVILMPPPPYTESSFRTWISILEDVSLYIHVVSKNNSLTLGLKTNEFTDALGVIKQSKAFFSPVHPFWLTYMYI